MLLDYFVSFAPWISYIVVLQVADSWRFGFAAGLGIAAVLVIWRTVRRDSRFLDVGTLSYCAIMTMVSALDPSSPVRPYNVPLSLAAIGGLSTVSLLMRSPFTYRIERNHIPERVLDDPVLHDLFYRAHVTATSSWAVCQSVAAAIAAVFIHAKLAPGAVIVQIVGTLTPVGMTRYHHERFVESIDTDAA